MQLIICQRDFVSIPIYTIAYGVQAGPVTKIINKFLDCLKHDRSLCHECAHVGMSCWYRMLVCHVGTVCAMTKQLSNVML